MPLNRPFIDAHGKRGKPKLTIKKIVRNIQFEQYSSTHLALSIPNLPKKLIVSKSNCIKLAHWLLDKCTTRRE